MKISDLFNEAFEEGINVQINEHVDQDVNGK